MGGGGEGGRDHASSGVHSHYRFIIVSPDGVSPGIKSIRQITYNNLQHGAHNQQRCYFSYGWIPHVQTLVFQASSFFQAF